MSWVISGSEKLDVAGIQNVSLLLHGNADSSGNILDSSPSPKTISKFGQAASATPPSYPNSNSVFGNAIAFDGTGDYLTSTSSDFTFGTGDFTIEAFVYANSISSRRTIVSVTDGATTGGIGLLMFNTTQFEVTTPGLSVDHVFSATIPLSTWFHVALTRANSSLRCFLNGNQVGSTLPSTRNYSQTRFVAGIDTDLSGQALNGYLAENRLTKGVARYQAAFTAPTAPFPDA